MTAKTTQRFQPRLEALEGRSLMAAGITASLAANGTLTVNATTGSDSLIVIQDPRSGQIMVRDHLKVGTDNLATHDAGALVAINVGGVMQNTVATSKVNKVVVNGNGGDDTINLRYTDIYAKFGPVSCTVTKTACVYGGSGNDTLIGGNGDNYLYGGAGDDILIGGSDENYLDGGTGHDRLIGGSGVNTYHEDFASIYPTAGLDPTTIQQGRSSETNQFLTALTSVARSSPTDLQQISSLGSNNYNVPLFWNGSRENIKVSFNGTWTDSDPNPSEDVQGRIVGDSWVLLTWRAFTQQQHAHFFNLSGSQLEAHWSTADTLNSLTGNSSARRGSQVTAAALLQDFQTHQGVVVWTRASDLVNPQAHTAGLAGSTDYAVLGIENIQVTNAQHHTVTETVVHLRRLGTSSPNDGIITVCLNDLVSSLTGYFAGASL
jgi:Ca2+-binding RTX toxin-like protein